MNMFRTILLSATVVALGGCTAFTSFSEVDALNDAKAVGSPFTQALADEYRTFSNSELKNKFDYPDALHFARKGLAAAAGENVLPEPVVDWNLDEPQIQELGAARGRLIVAYDLGARETAPALSAKAQSRFDCWIEHQEENWRGGEDVNRCKTEFAQAMTELESQLQVPPPAEGPVEPIANYGVDPNAPMQSENAMYLVFFDWDSSKLGGGAISVIDAVAAEIAKNPPASVNITGHADTSGPQDYNEKLALKRANRVRDALIKRGVDASIIKVDARGETELLVQTPDNVREPANRRVNISFN